MKRLLCMALLLSTCGCYPPKEQAQPKSSVKSEPRVEINIDPYTDCRDDDNKNYIPEAYRQQVRNCL